MFLTIELKAGPNHRDGITKKDVQKNIDALLRFAKGNQIVSDFNLLMDTVSILEGIQNQLKE